MVHKVECPGDLALEFNDSCTTGWYQRRLYIAIFQRAALHVYIVKYLPDHVEGRNQIWSRITYIQPDSLSDFHLHSIGS